MRQVIDVQNKCNTVNSVKLVINLNDNGEGDFE